MARSEAAKAVEAAEAAEAEVERAKAETAAAQAGGAAAEDGAEVATEGSVVPGGSRVEELEGTLPLMISSSSAHGLSLFWSRVEELEDEPLSRE